jgi:hypothetical protein
MPLLTTDHADHPQGSGVQLHLRGRQRLQGRRRPDLNDRLSSGNSYRIVLQREYFSHFSIEFYLIVLTQQMSSRSLSMVDIIRSSSGTRQKRAYLGIKFIKSIVDSRSHILLIHVHSPKWHLVPDSQLGRGVGATAAGHAAMDEHVAREGSASRLRRVCRLFHFCLFWHSTSKTYFMSFQQMSHLHANTSARPTMSVSTATSRPTWSRSSAHEGWW